MTRIDFIRNTADHTQKFSVELASGSYLMMLGDFQDQWEHCIGKSTKPMTARINLTFRLLPETEICSPVIQAASSEARNTTAFAISSG